MRQRCGSSCTRLALPASRPSLEWALVLPHWWYFHDPVVRGSCNQTTPLVRRPALPVCAHIHCTRGPWIAKPRALDQRCLGAAISTKGQRGRTTLRRHRTFAVHVLRSAQWRLRPFATCNDAVCMQLFCCDMLEPYTGSSYTRCSGSYRRM